jgi:uncharacterized protein
VSEDLARNVVAFAARLRGEHEYGIIPGQTHDAVRALELLGLTDRERVRAALRAALCSKPVEVESFDELFDAFFSNTRPGTAQPQQPQYTRPDATDDPAQDAAPQEPRSPQSREPADGGTSAETAFEPAAESLAEAWMAMHARYSPAAAPKDGATIPQVGIDEAYARAQHLVSKIRLGRALRWKPQARGRRFDLRRTLRASLSTGGETIQLRRLGHPLRNPRFVLLLDGSRSMEPYAGPMLQFALALCRRTRRADAFLFSTELRDITRDLRQAATCGSFELSGLGEAWGGGTRIGANLNAFVRRFGSRLTEHTFTIVFSDGLDVGDIGDLEHAMRELHRRSAAIAWVNPHAAEPGYTPSVRGMQAALPYVDIFAGMDDLRVLAGVARRNGSAA